MRKILRVRDTHRSEKGGGRQGDGRGREGRETTLSPTPDRVFLVFPVDFIMLSFPSCLYLPR